MKFKVVVLLLSVVFLASCSNSRYGRIPKAKKQKHSVAKKQFKKNKLNTLELVAIKRTIQATDFQNPELVLNKVEAVNVEGKKIASKRGAKTTIAAPTVVKNIDAVKQILKPNKIKQLEKNTNTKEIAKGSWLWYVIVGIVLILIGGLIGTVIGSIFYIVGVIAVILGLLILLGLL